MTTPVASKTTTAFYVQAVISFTVSVITVLGGIAWLPVGGPWRAFLGLGLLYAVTSSFALAKCVRDRQEAENVITRVDKARLERLLADHDPFVTPR
jgi:hypothetical protein